MGTFLAEFEARIESGVVIDHNFVPGNYAVGENGTREVDAFHSRLALAVASRDDE